MDRAFEKLSLFLESSPFEQSGASFKAAFDSAELFDYFGEFWMKIVFGVLLTL
jgi:hypothetical protein